MCSYDLEFKWHCLQLDKQHKQNTAELAEALKMLPVFQGGMGEKTFFIQTNLSA